MIQPVENTKILLAFEEIVESRGQSIPCYAKSDKGLSFVECLNSLCQSLHQVDHMNFLGTIGSKVPENKPLIDYFNISWKILMKALQIELTESGEYNVLNQNLVQNYARRIRSNPTEEMLSAGDIPEYLDMDKTRIQLRKMSTMKLKRRKLSRRKF